MNFGLDWPPHLGHAGRREGRDRGRKQLVDLRQNVPFLSRARPRYPHVPSPTSTVATFTCSSDGTRSSNGSASNASSGRYSGHNSPVYASRFFNSSPSQLHSILATSCTPLVWDVRKPPKDLSVARSASKIYGPHSLSFPLTSTAAGHVVLLSRDFPWSIEIGPKNRAITAQDVLYAIYDKLQEDLDDVAWSFASRETKSNINRAWKRRLEVCSAVPVGSATGSDAGGKGDKDREDMPKNVDWLLKRHMFKGLYRDDRFAKKRLPPGSSFVPETWIILFARQEYVF